MDPLILASLRGDLPAVERLLAEGADPRAADAKGNTPLILAASLGHADVVERLLPLSDPEARDAASDWNAFEHALSGNRLDCVRLLAPATDLSRLDSERRSPLMRAALFLDAQAVEALLPFCDPLQENADGEIALHFAVAAPIQLSCVKALLPFGGLGHADKDGETPLLKAAILNNADAAALLLADPSCEPNRADNNGVTPLLRAATQGNAPFVRLLLDRIGLPQAGDDWPKEKNPLARAAHNGSVECLELLSPFFDASFFDGALRNAANEGHEGAVRFLLPRADARAASPIGTTALMCAASHGDAETVRLLIPASDIDAKNGAGKTALLLAAARNRHEAAALLAPLASHEAGSGGDTPMKLALEVGERSRDWWTAVVLFPFADAADRERALKECPWVRQLEESLARHEAENLRGQLFGGATATPPSAPVDGALQGEQNLAAKTAARRPPKAL